MSLHFGKSSFLRRAWLFARDFVGEFAAAWGLARMWDCERTGGHRWGSGAYDGLMKSWGRTCARCGCWESTTPSAGTGITNATTMRIP